MIEYKFKTIHWHDGITEIQAVINEGEFKTAEIEMMGEKRTITYFDRQRVLATPLLKFKGHLEMDEIRKLFDCELVKFGKEPIPQQVSAIKTEELLKYEKL